MQLDVRLPIGLLFVINGVILIATGLLSDPAAYQKALGFNINLWWGLVMAVFGAIFLFFAQRTIIQNGKKS